MGREATSQVGVQTGVYWVTSELAIGGGSRPHTRHGP